MLLLIRRIQKYPMPSVNARLSMDVSGTRQLKQVEAKARKTKAKQAATINANQLWSQTSTQQYLTDYMEGLICKLIDTKL